MQKRKHSIDVNLKEEIYKFEQELQIGEIISRPNRFIMNVRIGEDVVKCHCPTTGKIGNISLAGLPCLLSSSTDKNRKTLHTVEAISVDNTVSWAGINQNAVNRYIEFFFKNELLEGIVANGHKVLREQRIGDSKLDFKIENTYIEVKMPLMYLPCATSNMNEISQRRIMLFERFVRHINELGSCLKNSGTAVMITCFMYDAPMFQIPPMSERNKVIADAVFQAVSSGVKMWQVNLGIDKESVRLIKYFDITHIFESLLKRASNPV